MAVDVDSTLSVCFLLHVTQQEGTHKGRPIYPPHTHTHTHTHVLYIYIYSMYIHTHMYFIYIYREREREPRLKKK